MRLPGVLRAVGTRVGLVRVVVDAWIHWQRVDRPLCSFHTANLSRTDHAEKALSTVSVPLFLLDEAQFPKLVHEDVHARCVVPTISARVSCRSSSAASGPGCGRRRSVREESVRATVSR